jgi:cytoskeletal protein CcmA (bactofilin family)
LGAPDARAPRIPATRMVHGYDRRMRCRALVATAVAGLLLLATALPAAAQNGGGGEEQSRRINVTGGLVVAEGETVDGPAVSVNGRARIDGRVNGAVYVGRGDLLIAGRVTGDVLVLDGDATISGRVDHDITVLNGKATVTPGADVFGDVTSRTTPTAARGTVRGRVEKLDVGTLFAGFIVVLLALLWVAVTLSTAILGLLFVWLLPRAADGAVVAGRRIWASFFLGLGVGIIGPILGVIVFASVVGIPLAFAVFGTLAVLGPLGYVASSVIIGRLVVRGTGTGGRIGAFFLGFGILRFGALIPGIGFLIGFVFATYGLGALTIAGWRAGRRAFGAPGATEEMAALGPPPQPELATAGTSAGRTGSPSTGFTIKQTGRTRRAPVKKAKAPAKKRRTRVKASGAKRSTAARSRRTTARKSGPRKTTAKKRTVRAKRSGARRSTSTRSKKAPARKAPAKKARSRRTTAKKRTTSAKRAGSKRSQPAKSRTARSKSSTSKKSTARKSSRSRSGARR